MDNFKDDEELLSFYSDEKPRKQLLRNYPLTHQNLHAQQKGKTEDDLFKSGCRRVTRSHAISGTLTSLTSLSADRLSV